MDNLARNAMLAKEAGMSYGRWKAMQAPVEVKKPEPDKNTVICPECGVSFVKGHYNQKYCSWHCQNLVAARRHRLRKAKKR